MGKEFFVCFDGNYVRFQNQLEVSLGSGMIECRPYKYPKFPELENTEIRGFRVTGVALARSSVTLLTSVVALAHEKEALALVEVVLALVAAFCFAESVL